MSSLWVALGFLSRLPTKHATFSEAEAARSVFWFPAVGLLIGVLVALAARLALPVLGPDVSAVVALGLWVGLTGALHLDGLADTSDGFSAANRGTERALGAMKDSRIGAHGACALVLVLLGKWALLRRCAEVGVLAPSVVVAVTTARWAVGFSLAWATPAVPTGLGALFSRELRTQAARWIPWAGSLWLVGLAFGLCWFQSTPGHTSVVGVLVSILATILVSIVFTRRCNACFGGVTGDTHGASIELCELVVLVTHAALFGIMNT